MSKWRKSSFCGDTGCVYAKSEGSDILIRTSEDVRTMRIPGKDWEALIAGVKNGEFDLDQMG